MRKEAAKYAQDLRNRGGSGPWACKLCPYRCFLRKPHLVDHQKYHRPPYFTAAAAAKKTTRLGAQFNVARANFRQRVVESVLTNNPPTHDLLAKSSATIRDWTASASTDEKDLLKRSNVVPLVLVWAKDGPKYVLRSQTVNLLRLNGKQYYTRDFENVLIAEAVLCRGQIAMIIGNFHARWSESSSMTAMLSFQLAGLRDLMHHVFTHPDGLVQTTLSELKHKATLRGEWVGLAHDATFKCTFSIIGQEKMKQKSNEYHTAHTFLGVTGSCPGFSLQPKEGAEGFGCALRERCTPEMIAQVRFLFSDSPNESFLAYLPNALGVAEDNLHLVFRIEYCTGGKRTSCTSEVLRIQQKFRNAVEGPADNLIATIYHGEAGFLSWSDTLAAAERDNATWTEYLQKPFESHREYVAELKRITAKYSSEMNKQDKKGDSMLKLLQNGSSRRHFGYLQNNSIFRAIAGDVEILPGTSVNEAEHRRLKRWMECVYQQHTDRLQMIQEVHGLYKMMTNAYLNTQLDSAKVMRERSVLCLLAGCIAAGRMSIGTAPAPPIQQPLLPPVNRKGLVRVQVRVPEERVERTQRRAKVRKDAWKSQLNINMKSKKPISKNIFLKRRVLRKTSDASTLSIGQVKKSDQKRAKKQSDKLMQRVEENIKNNLGAD